MKRKFIITMLIITTLVQSGHAQASDFAKVQHRYAQLEDVMEIIDTTELKAKLAEVENQHRENSSELSSVRLGIIYHETALNLSFLSKTSYKGYAQKSYEQLSKLYNASSTTPALLPYIAAYRASALALMAGETRKLKLLGKAFGLFREAADKYAHLSPLPEFLRGSVAENLPWFLFSKRKFAKQDFQSIISKQANQPDYANWKIMSFTFWAWANQHSRKRDRSQALEYLEKAIALDPQYKAGRERAEALKKTYLKW
jgi:tetratricopeptide (TPR) repeat protein